MFSDMRSGDIVSKWSLLNSICFVSQNRPHKPAFFITAHTDTRGTISPLQLTVHAEEGLPLQKLQFPLTLLWKTPGSFLSSSWPSPHSGALPALHSSVSSAAAASPPFLGSVACSHPGRSFTFLSPCISLYCVLTSVQKQIFPEGANSVKQQCKVGAKLGVISTINNSPSDQEWGHCEGWTPPGAASCPLLFCLLHQYQLAVNLGKTFFYYLNMGAGGCSWTTADLQVLVPWMSEKSSLAPRWPRRYPFPEKQGRGRAGAQPAWMEWGYGSVFTWAGQSEDLWVLGFFTLRIATSPYKKP